MRSPLHPTKDRLTPDSPTAFNPSTDRLTADSSPARDVTGQPADAPHSPAPSARARAALGYVAAGVPVLPLYEVRGDGRCACGRPACDRPGKHPRIPHGVHNASTDPRQVARWWRWWPYANVGAATGHVFDVWDIDLPDARVLLAGYLPDRADSWPRVRTGSGGTHVFVAPTGHGNRAKFVPGCDWRGRAGYVVLPPSVHASGHTYAWQVPPQFSTRVDLGTACRLMVPSAPGLLLAALAPASMRATPARAWHATSADRYAATALRRECAHLAAMEPDSGRNNALNRAAFNLGQLAAAGHLDQGDITDALTHAASCSGLPPGEAARTIASGLAAGQRYPRTRRGRA